MYEFSVTVPDYTMYVTTGITVALAWNLPDKPTYPELEYSERIENGSSVYQESMIQNKNDVNSNHYNDGTVNNSSFSGVINTKLNTTKPTYLKSTKNDIVNRIANYAAHYFQNRRPDSYYFGFGRNSSFGLRNYTAYNHYYSNDNGSDNSSAFRPPYSTIYSVNPPNDATYMIETYFKPWIKSLEIASKSM